MTSGNQITSNLHALVLLALLAFSVVALATPLPVMATSNVVTGNLWHVPEGTAQNAIPANVPASTPDVVFSVNSPLSFDSRIDSGDYTVGGWLDSGGAFGVIENTGGTLSSSMDPTIIEFTGLVTVTTGQSFTVAHDDGLTLIIGGVTVINAPGPTSPTTTTATYTGPSGTQPFKLVYGECCGFPAVLNVALPFFSPPTGVPQFPLGIVALFAVLVPVLLVLRRWSLPSRKIGV